MRRRIAVVGSGISGLACAYLLAEDDDVVLFERDARIGGHARTLDAELDGATRPVDTGFIVFNSVNYPLLTNLFRHLDVATETSDMSFAVSYDDGKLEFSGSSLKGLFAQPSNIVSPKYWRMLRDILAVFRGAPRILDAPGDPSLGEMLDSLGTGAWARDRFFLPMGAAIWSTPPGQIRAMPAKSFVRFFQNHGLLSVSGHHQWRTVTRGSRSYVARIAAASKARVRLAAPVTRIVEAAGGGFEVVTADLAREAFDEVVLACHADTALALLAAPTPDERDVLGAFSFRDNEVVLHLDAALMPRRRNAWASWCYAAGGAETNQRMSVTYWMNALQNLPAPDIFVSVNPHRHIAEKLVIDRHTFRHPVMSPDAIAAQRRIPDIQGKRGLWFCGAWQRWGFHEDGLWSAVRVAEAKGRRLPWA
ncbi:MAG: FAD-dependent oxidoreductase [Hyphomicrobiaceae bacterium]|nr:FAD-dependent oxidoreductase [Hyphomicrobiaceae bacterium]